VPPLSGFLGKLAILGGMFESRAYWVGAAVLVAGLLTLVSMGRTWADAFWKPSATARDLSTPGAALLVAIAGLNLVTLAISVRAGPLFDLASRAAHQLLQRDDYMRAVLGGP
jgi:multicomponent Na+:H+ antiporter subunit D